MHLLHGAESAGEIKLNMGKNSRVGELEELVAELEANLVLRLDSSEEGSLADRFDQRRLPRILPRGPRGMTQLPRKQVRWRPQLVVGFRGFGASESLHAQHVLPQNFLGFRVSLYPVAWLVWSRPGRNSQCKQEAQTPNDFPLLLHPFDFSLQKNYKRKKRKNLEKKGQISRSRRRRPMKRCCRLLHNAAFQWLVVVAVITTTSSCLGNQEKIRNSIAQ